MSTYIEDSRYFNIMSINKVQCKCGCSQSISPTKKNSICRWCGRTIWKNKREEFKNKLNKEMRKNNYDTKRIN